MAAAAVVLVGRSAVRSVKPRFTYLHTGTAHTLHDSPHRGPCCYLDAGFTRRRRAPVLAVEDFRAVQDRHRASENRAMVAGPVAPPRHVLPPPPRAAQQHVGLPNVLCQTLQQASTVLNTQRYPEQAFKGRGSQ